MYDLCIKYQYIECIVLKNDGCCINVMLKKVKVLFQCVIYVLVFIILINVVNLKRNKIKIEIYKFFFLIRNIKLGKIFKNNLEKLIQVEEYNKQLYYQMI